MASNESKVQWTRSLHSVATAASYLAESLDLSAPTAQEFAENITASSARLTTVELGNLALNLAEVGGALVELSSVTVESETHQRELPEDTERLHLVNEVFDSTSTETEIVEEAEPEPEPKAEPILRTVEPEAPKTAASKPRPVPAKIIDLRPAAKPKARKERQTRAPRIVPDDLSEERPVQTRINTEVVDPIKRYLIEIGRYPLIDKEEEQRLSKLVRAGLEARDKLGGKVEWASGDTERGLNRVAQIGKNAKTDFMQANLRLVVSIAKRYRARAGTLDFLDLIQEGNLGLEHAIDKFDGERGFKFSTYSTNWIRQSIVRGIANTATPIRIPVHEHDVLKRLGVAEEEVKSQGLQLTGAEFDRQVAATMEIPLKRLKQIRTERQTQNPASLNKTVNEDGDAELQDLIVDNISASQLDEALTDISYDGDIKEMFALLNKMEALIIASRYGLIGGLEPMTLEQVSEHLIAVERQENPNSIIPVTAGVTRERVRQIESIATMKMSRFRVFPELVKQLGLDPEQKKRFEVYFMAAPIYHGPEARYQRSGVKSGDMHRIIARNVWSILDEKFGKNRMEFVIKSVLDDNAITHSGTRDIPSGKVYTDLMVRLGVSPLQKYQTTQKLQHDFLSKASHKLETEVLRRLLGMPDY